MSENQVLENIYTMSEMDPEDLMKWLVQEYLSPIPSELSSPEDMQIAGNLLGTLANKRTFLSGLFCLLKMKARIEKNKGKDNRKNAEDMAIRRDIVETVLDSVKGQYDAVSRMMTAHKMEIDELKALGDGPRYKY